MLLMSSFALLDVNCPCDILIRLLSLWSHSEGHKSISFVFDKYGEVKYI